MRPSPGRRPPISGLPEIGTVARKSATADLRWLASRAPQGDGNESLLVMLVVTVLVIGCSRTLRGAQPRRFRFQIGDQVAGIEIGNPQGRHVHAREPGGELERHGVLLGPHPGRGPDVACEPGALAALGDAAQVGPDTAAHADRMAGRAYLLEHRLAGLIAELITGVAGGTVRRQADLIAPLRIHATD